MLWLYLPWLYSLWLYLLWQDPLFTELAGTVRTALRTTTTSTRKGGGGDGGGGGGNDGGGGDEVGERGGPVLKSVRDEDGFGTLLTLRNRPFLSELWPDMVSLPMDGEVRHVPSSEPQQRQPRAACARRLEIFLDKVPLSATHHTTHSVNMCNAFSLRCTVQRTLLLARSRSPYIYIYDSPYICV